MAASGGDMLSLKYALVSDNKELAEESLGKVASQDVSSPVSLIAIELIGTTL